MTPQPRFWRNKKILALAVLTMAVGVAEGYYARRQFDAREAGTLQAVRSQLQEAADDRARLIEAWAADMLGDGQVVASYPSVLDLLAAGRPSARLLNPPAPGHVGTLLESLNRLQGYRAACLTDRAGSQVVRSGDPLPDSLIEAVRAESLASGREVIDFFLAHGQPVIVTATPVPLGTAPDRADGLVLLVADPAKWLYPQLLRDEPSAPTEENLLVRGAGAGTELLSPPRDLVRPVPTHAFPAAHVPGTLADAAGTSTDHRGVPVIAASRPVPRTPWTVVSKIDRDEVVRGFRRVVWIWLLQSIVVLVALLSLVYAMLRHRQAVHASQEVKSSRQIGFLNRLLLTLSEVNELMVREKDRQRLLDETCRIIVQHAGFRMSWVGEVEPPGRVVAVASAGAVEGYFDGIDIRYDDSLPGQGPTGTAIRERQTVAVDDISDNPRMARWRQRALQRGYRSTVAVPLISGGRVLGALIVYSLEPGMFRGETLALLERLANDLAFALDVVERQARHRETEQVLGVREEQLRQAQKMEAVGRLAGGVAHDFNNLLMAISGYAELALSATTEESRRERIEEIAIAAERAAALTRQLLAFSRKQVLQPKVFNLNIVVSEIEKMLSRLIGDNIELVTRLADDLDNVRADPGQLEQVLVNLAVNARDAMPDGGRVVIGTRNVNGRSGDCVAGGELEAGAYVELSVTDSGEGMSPEILDHLFEPFFTTKESGKGTGLGLSMVYGIVKQSGGAITVESVAGEGTSFRVYLPVSAAEQPKQAEPAPVLRSAGGESLLVVEDNGAVRNFVTEALRSAGYQVFDAENAESALDLLSISADAVDLLLTDVVLPKMDGYELARLAVAARPSLKVLYMSGYADNPKLRDAALHHGIDLIEKPFTSAAIAARVRAVLDRAGVE